MYHIPLRSNSNEGKVTYANLMTPGSPMKQPPLLVDEDSKLPEAPLGFAFYRVKSGDTLVSLSVRFSVSQNSIRRYNGKAACFGHRLTHIIGKLLLIPIAPNASLTAEMQEQLANVYDDDESNLHDDSEAREYKEPNENGKYQLRKALMFHCRNLDELRADFYLAEASWNIRKALKAWQGDDRWEKTQKVMKLFSLQESVAKQLLTTCHWNVEECIKHWKKHKTVATPGQNNRNRNSNSNNNNIEEEEEEVGGSQEAEGDRSGYTTVRTTTTEMSTITSTIGKAKANTGKKNN